MWLVGFRVTSLDNLNTSTHPIDEAGGIMFSGLLSICACINACVRSSMLTQAEAFADWLAVDNIRHISHCSGLFGVH